MDRLVGIIDPTPDDFWWGHDGRHERAAEDAAEISRLIAHLDDDCPDLDELEEADAG